MDLFKAPTKRNIPLAMYHRAVVSAVKFHQRLVNGPGTKVPDHHAIRGQIPSTSPVRPKNRMNPPASSGAKSMLMAKASVAVPINNQLTSPRRMTTI